MKDFTHIDEGFLKPRLKTRTDDTHKGDYGQLLIIAGCQRMPGAALLTTGSALHSGCGLVTLHSTERALQATVSAFPSAKLQENPGECFSIVPKICEHNKAVYRAVAVGPGLGTEPDSRAALRELLCLINEWNGHDSEIDRISLVLDADALNIISANPDIVSLIPSGSVLTPHSGELKRLLKKDFNQIEDEKEKEEVINKAIEEFVEKTKCILVRKGFHTKIYSPNGNRLVNTTGNPGMAKGGSGDVLTGLISGLIARGYDALTASALGVWVHGKSGDYLSQERTPEAYDGKDLIDYLWVGFKTLYDFKAENE